MTTGLAAHKTGGPSGIAVLFILLIGTIVLLSLLGYLGSRFANRDRQPLGDRWWLGGITVLSGCAAITVYLWGALHLLFIEEPDMRKACLNAAMNAQEASVLGYETSYLPPRLICRMSDGESYAAIVPSWVAIGLAVSVALALIAGLVHGMTRNDLTHG